MKTRKQSRVRATKLPRRITTINDLFVRDDVNDILADLNRDKADIKDLVVIAVNRKTGGYSWAITQDTFESTIVWLLESLKRDIMNREDEGD